MDYNAILNQLKQWISSLNGKGVPLPVIRDPKTNVGSFSATLLVIATILHVYGIIHGWVSPDAKLDVSHSFEFFLACASLYFFRSLTYKAPMGGTTKVAGEVEAEEPKDTKKQDSNEEGKAEGQ